MSDDAEPDAVEASMLDDSDSDATSCGFSTVDADETGSSGVGNAVAGDVTVEGWDKLGDETDEKGDWQPVKRKALKVIGRTILVIGCFITDTSFEFFCETARKIEKR